MSRLFSCSKVPVFLDTYAPGIEKRRGEEVSILTLTLRVQPFDHQLATALDDGVGSSIRPHIFGLTTAEPLPEFTRHDFKLDVPRQMLTLFASPDTMEARLAIDQVKIAKTYIRTQKDVNALAFVFKASFGPVSRDELEYVHAWVNGQRFVTFTESETAMDFEEDDVDDADDDATDDEDRTPMFDTEPDGRVLEAAAKTPASKRRTRVQ